MPRDSRSAPVDRSVTPSLDAPAVPEIPPGVVPVPLTREARLILAVDRFIYRVARRWLWIANGLGASMVIPPLLAPLLMATGHQTLAGLIYRAFSLVCHQMPERSFFLFGYQMAYCQRDTAIYSGVLALGLLYGLVRRYIRPLGLRWAALFALPMAIDGFTQLFGLSESTWELRVVTGSLFALAVVWVVFPRLEQGFAEIRAILEERFDRLAREGRARPLVSRQ
jgi:uncharacterized membrane protein